MKMYSVFRTTHMDQRDLTDTWSRHLVATLDHGKANDSSFIKISAQYEKSPNLNPKWWLKLIIFSF